MSQLEQEVYRADGKLLHLAMYMETKGLMVQNIPPSQIFERFKELKNKVLMGSLTMEALEERIYKKYGVHSG